jgi:hypothetical protein
VKRRLFKFAVAGSLAMTVLVTALWTRSYWVADVFVLFERDGSICVLQSGQGALAIGRHTNASSGRRLYSVRYNPGDRVFLPLPLRARSMHLFGSQRWLSVAYYVPIVILAVAWFVWLRRLIPGRASF